MPTQIQNTQSNLITSPSLVRTLAIPQTLTWITGDGIASYSYNRQSHTHLMYEKLSKVQTQNVIILGGVKFTQSLF